MTDISKLSNGNVTYNIKDAVARNSISNLANVATSGDYADLTNTPTIPAAQVQSDWNATSGMGVILNKPTVDQTYNATSSNAQSGIAVKLAIDSAISSVYKPAGSSTFSALPTPDSTNIGYVYNMSEAFETDSRFVEGAGKTYPAGTNIVIVKIDSSTYKFDVLTGFIDLSGYATTSSLSTVATSGDYADLTNTPTLSSVQSDWNVSDTSSMAYIINKPTIPTSTSSIVNNSTDVLTSGGAYANLVSSVTINTSPDKIDILKNGITSTITVNKVAYANSSGYTSSSGSAGYISSYLPKWPGKSLVAGTAISANQLVYMYNGKIYPISGTSYNLNPNFGIHICTSAVSSGGTVYYFYMKQKASVTSLSNISHATFSAGNSCYLRCTIDSSGNIKSNNYVTTSMSAGYTWYYIGQAISSTEIYVDTTSSMFITLDSSGNVTHINGKKLGASVSLKTINNQSLIGTGNIDVGAINLRNNEELNLWQGSEREYNNGEILKTYRYYSAESVPSNTEINNSNFVGNYVNFFDDKFWLLKGDDSYISTDGVNWTSKSTNIPLYINHDSVIYNNKILTYDILLEYNKSNDTWSSTSYTFNTSSNRYSVECMGVDDNGIFIAAGTDRNLSQSKTNKIQYSEDGINWTEITVPTFGYWYHIVYGNGLWIITSLYGADGYIYSEDGINWNSSNYPVSRVFTPSFCNNKFILTTDNRYYNYYSEDGINWTEMPVRPTAYHGKILYTNGMYVDPGSQSTSSTIEYSEDGINWITISVNSRQWSGNYSSCGNGIFIVGAYSSYYYNKLTIDNKHCYVTDNPPTTSSIVYTDVDQTSQYTITSVSGNNISLTDGNTYTLNANNNIDIRGTIGEAHLDWLCFINNKCVTYGNGVIADNSNSIISKKFKVVDALPDNPESGVFYFIKE